MKVFLILVASGKISVAAPDAGVLNSRFIASTPLRLEYYDAGTHQLLAADADGDGVFADPGESGCHCKICGRPESVGFRHAPEAGACESGVAS